MMQPEDTINTKRFSLIPRTAAIIVIADGLIVFTGWLLGNDYLKSVFPGSLPMNPFTAVCFVLTGSAMLVLFSGHSSAASKTLFYAFTSFVGIWLRPR